MPMRSLEQWLAHQEKVHPQSIDLGLTRLVAGTRSPALAAAGRAGDHRRGHQRQGFGRRLLRRDAGGGRLPGRHLHVAASARLSRANSRE